MTTDPERNRNPSEIVGYDGAQETVNAVVSGLNLVTIVIGFALAVLPQTITTDATTNSGTALQAYGSIGIAFLATIPVCIGEISSFSRKGVLEEIGVSKRGATIRSLLKIGSILGLLAACAGVGFSLVSIASSHHNDCATLVLLGITFAALVFIFFYRTYVAFIIGRIQNGLELNRSENHSESENGQ